VQKSQLARLEYFSGGREPLVAPGDAIRINQVQAEELSASHSGAREARTRNP
jgi:hypothetical protein